MVDLIEVYSSWVNPPYINAWLKKTILTPPRGVLIGYPRTVLPFSATIVLDLLLEAQTDIWPNIEILFYGV